MESRHSSLAKAGRVIATRSQGNYKLVSHKWLQGYLNEFTWRYNHRHDRRAMFHTLIERAAAPA
jgi:hypothetical protein